MSDIFNSIWIYELAIIQRYHIWYWHFQTWNMCSNSQFNGFIPHNDVAWECEGLHIDNMYITSLSAHIEPLTLERQMAKCNPARESISKKVIRKMSVNFINCIWGLIMIYNLGKVKMTYNQIYILIVINF